jgi:hypothetical protein
MYNIENYKNTKINEQTAVISKDYDERLKGYLDDEDLLEVLSDAFKALDHGEITTTSELDIDAKSYGILDGDVIHVEVNKEDENKPMFTMWVVNDEYVFDGVDIKKAAGYFEQSLIGDGVIGTIGNYLGSLVGLGDAGDDGTDEEKLIGVAGALGAIAVEKRLDPKVYFDALANEVGDMTGKLETEFSGRAEATALNLFRQEVSDSWTRGINLGSILGDIALTLGTLGMGTAARVAAKGTGAATKALKYTGAASKAASGAKGVAKLTGKLTNAWNGLSTSVKTARLNKLAKSGKPLEYIGKGANATKVPKVIHSIKNGQIFWKGSKGGAIKGPLVGNVTSIGGGMSLSAGSLALLAPGTAKKLAMAGAGVSSTANKAEALKYSSMNPAELMGYYDGLTADPSKYLDTIKDSDHQTLAKTLLDLKKGTGFWGNTTDTEELQIALIITSLSPKGALDIQKEYETIDPGFSIYDVLDDELGGDMGRMAKVWWAALTGDGANKHPEIQLYKNAITGGKNIKSSEE